MVKVYCVSLFWRLPSTYWCRNPGPNQGPSVYYKLTASACFEQYLLIIRRHCIHNSWYSLRCGLAATRVLVVLVQLHLFSSLKLKTYNFCK
jgi:hypothetical protein